MINTMSEEFLDWLQQCPVQWQLIEHEEGSGEATYRFFEEESEER